MKLAEIELTVTSGTPGHVLGEARLPGCDMPFFWSSSREGYYVTPGDNVHVTYGPYSTVTDLRRAMLGLARSEAA